VKPAALALLALTLSIGCYSMTPHRAQLAANAHPPDCAAAVADVFASSGYLQLATPPSLSMFFSPRMTGPYSSFLGTGVGVGVTIDPAGPAASTCNVTMEALSPDVNCADEHQAMTCGGPGEVRTTPILGTGPGLSNYERLWPKRCPVTPSLACAYTYAPGAENDAAVDELARRVRARLGVRASVN
jgi:hypothetical protein